jgi:hypothetical protein
MKNQVLVVCGGEGQQLQRQPTTTKTRVLRRPNGGRQPNCSNKAKAAAARTSRALC